MNDLDEQRIRNLRTAGWGYKAIAEFCALTRDQVRSYCTTRNLDAAPVMVERVCQWCALYREGLGLGFARPPAGIKRGGIDRKPSLCASRPVRTADAASRSWTNQVKSFAVTPAMCVLALAPGADDHERSHGSG